MFYGVFLVTLHYSYDILSTELIRFFIFTSQNLSFFAFNKILFWYCIEHLERQKIQVLLFLFIYLWKCYISIWWNILKYPYVSTYLCLLVFCHCVENIIWFVFKMIQFTFNIIMIKGAYNSQIIVIILFNRVLT